MFNTLLFLEWWWGGSCGLGETMLTTLAGGTTPQHTHMRAHMHVHPISSQAFHRLELEILRL